MLLWLRGLDSGKGAMEKYADILKREFGCMATLAESCLNPDYDSGQSQLKAVDPAVFEALGIRSLGEKLLFSKGIIALSAEGAR